MCYLHSTLDHSLEAFIGDAPEDCHVLEYVDASFADDVNDSKSTSGMFIAIVGPHTFVPITAFSKRQNAVSHSSTESEIVALEEAVRSEGLPTLTFWEHVVMLFGTPKAQTAQITNTVKEPKSNTSAPTGGLRNNNVPSFETFMAQKLCDYKQLLEKEGQPDAAARMERAIAHVSTINIGAHAFDAIKHFFDTRSEFPMVNLIVAEDNEAVIKILAKGRSGKLRHVPRTHRVNIDWLYDAFRHPEVVARYVRTMYQTADIGTKAITKAEDWIRLQRLMMITRDGPISGSDEPAARIGENKTNKTTTSKDIVPIEVARTITNECGSIQCRQCDINQREMALGGCCSWGSPRVFPGCSDQPMPQPPRQGKKTNRRGKRGRHNDKTPNNTTNTWEVRG